MCGGGGKGLSQSSMSQSQANPFAMMQYANAINQVNQATSAPFKRYSSNAADYISPLTGTQTGAISNISGMAGMTDPYYQAAAGLTGAGAQGVGRLTGQQIQEYMNPYMSQVIDPTRQALQQQFGQQLAQQQAEAIKGGAFGGERAGLQRQALRGQQALGLGQALSPLYQTGYGQALQTAQGQQAVEQANLQRLLAAGQQFGGLGSAAQAAALQQAQAQLQAGTLEQQTATAGLQALYGEAQKERMYPLQAAAARAQGIAALAPLTGSQTSGYSLQPFFGGLAAAGGAINSPERMGGAVTSGGDYADGGMAEEVEFPSFDIRPGRLDAPELPREQRQSPVNLSNAAKIAQAGFKARDYMKQNPDASWMDTAASVLKSHGGFIPAFADGGDAEDSAWSQVLKPIVSSQPQQQQEQKKQGNGILGGLLKTGAGMAANYFLPGSGALVSAGLGAAGLASGGRAGYEDGGDIFERGVLGAESAHHQFDERGRPLTSPKGAIGIAQVMPGTAPEAAKLAGLPYDAERYRTDEKYNAALGRAYFNEQKRRFGDEEKAIAAYNAGPGAVERAIRRAEASGGDYKDYLPRETQAYIPSVMRHAGATDEGVGRALAAIPKGDPRRELMASAAPRGLGAAPVEKSFTENITDHPERLAVPILQGLGAMAGSKSRYLGSAILEGLGAGAKSYMDTGTALEEQRKIHEEAGAERAAATAAEAGALGKLREMPIWVDPNTGLRLVMLADGRAISMQEYLQNPRPVMGADQAAIVADQLGLQAAGKTQPGYAPEGGNMPTGVTAPQQTGFEPEGIQEGETVTLKPSAPVAPKQAPIIKTPEVKQIVGVTVGPAAKSAVNEEMTLASSIGGHGAMEDSKQAKAAIDKSAMAARPQAIYNAQVAQIISEAANAKNWDAPGAASETRASIVNGLNTLARSFGLGDKVFGEMESRDQMLKKINSMRAEATVTGANQAALGSLETVLGSLPSQGQSPRAGTFNAASNWVQNQRMIDRQNYANNYGLRSSGLYNRVDNAFSQDNPQSKYAAEEKAFQELMNHPAGPKIIDSFLHGRDMNGNPIKDPTIIDRFFEKNFKIPGMSRYFMGATGG